jgi:hypothetical protein
VPSPSDAGSPPCPACGGAVAREAARLAALLRADEVDAAIESGLMDFVPCAGCAQDDDAVVVADAQRRLRDAWAARERYRAREARLRRRDAERAARRAAQAASGPQAPALPPAAAAALARAKARAAAKKP